MMQWLIDLVTEKVIAEIGIPPVYINRGDPANWDFTKADLITDGTWRNLNLSAIVPVKATAVSLMLYAKLPLAGHYFRFRPAGNTNIHNHSGIRTQVALMGMYGDFTVPLDANRLVQYYAQAGIWLEIFIVIKGWWL